MAQIIGADGRTMDERSIQPGVLNGIDISKLPNGRYMLRLMGDNGNIILRPFVKE